MHRSELEDVSRRLGSTVVDATVLTGGFSHSTTLLTLASGLVVVRRGGRNPRIEAAVMAQAPVPTPPVLLLDDGLMVLEYVAAPMLADVLGATSRDEDTWELRGATRRGWITFDEPPAERARPGAGTVHHIAWGTTDADMPEWQQVLDRAGLPNSG